MSECLHHQSSGRKQDKFNYFLKVNLNEMGHRNAFDGLVRTWGLGLGILVAGMHRYVGLSCQPAYRLANHQSEPGQ